MAGVLGSFFGGSGDILIKVGADVKDAVSGLGEVHKSLGDTASTGAKLQHGIQAAAVPAAAALTGLAAAGIACAKAAADAQASQAALDDQIRRSTGASDAAIASNKEWMGVYSQQVAISQGELRPALAGLVRATGELSSAQELLTLSADTAAATHKDLASVSAAVGKAYNGQAGALKRLVPSISDAAIKSGDWAQIQKELNAQVGGAAQSEAQTTAGQYKLLTLQMKGLQVAIGTALLPTFQELIGIMTPLVALAKQHAALFAHVGVAIAGMAAAILALNIALKVYRAAQLAWIAVTKVARAVSIAWTAAQWLLNAALTANPIGLVVAAVVALGVALVIAYRHSQTFRNIVNGAFQAVIKYGWLLAGPLAPFILALKLAWEHAATLKAIAVDAFNAIARAIDYLVGKIGGLISKLGSIHVPHIPGVNAAGYYAPAPMRIGPGAFAAETGSGMIVNVSVTGAIDPESTAIQIRRILQRHDRRRGRSPLGGEAPEA